MNLVPAIEALEEQMSELEKNYRRERADLEEGLKALRKLNTVCERCKGKGKVLRSRVCAEDDRPDPDDIRDWKMCEICNGIGKVLPIAYFKELK